MLLVSGGTSTWRPVIAQQPDLFGVLAVPADGNSIPEICRWAGDNGAYSGFDKASFLAMLERHRWAKERCLFVVAPDVVGCAEGTREQFQEWGPRIRGFGYPVALAAQNGLTHLDVPWDDVDCIFIGGSPGCLNCAYVRPPGNFTERCSLCRGPLGEWKCGAAAARLVVEARLQGKWVHMGRVNTARRLRYAAALGVDSVDGSGWSKWPDAMLERHIVTLRHLSEQHRLVLGGGA